jgi:2-keto-4-pentenoate hydratase
MTPVSYTTCRTGIRTGRDGRVQGEDSDDRGIARQLVQARLGARALPRYPGPLPAGLDQGYVRQDIAISLWPAPVAGWKVGKIGDDWAARLGEDRLVGPIFADNLQEAGASAARFPVIAGGFAAVEAEFVFVLGADAPTGKTEWSEDEAAALVAELRVGVELAGSPLPDINRLGPAVVVSDFGNNAGLVLGPRIADWRRHGDDSLQCETFIGGRSVGTGRASSIVGGTLAALRFALSRCARRGLPLRAGQLVSTGAATGIHDILAGDAARVAFAGAGLMAPVDIAVQATSAVARADA